MNPALVLGGIKAGGSALKWALNLRNRTTDFGKTAYGRYLKKVGEQGLYGGTTRQEILNRAGAQTGNVAQERTAATRGYLTNRGFGNSISGLRLLDAPRSDRQRQMGNISRDLSIRNEETKDDAQSEYARQYTGYADQRRLESRRNNADLVGGLTDAGASWYQAKQYQDMIDMRKADKLSEEEFSNLEARIGLLLQMGRKDEALQLFMEHLGK